MLFFVCLFCIFFSSSSSNCHLPPDKYLCTTIVTKTWLQHCSFEPHFFICSVSFNHTIILFNQVFCCEFSGLINLLSTKLFNWHSIFTIYIYNYNDIWSSSIIFMPLFWWYVFLVWYSYWLYKCLIFLCMHRQFSCIITRSFSRTLSNLLCNFVSNQVTSRLSILFHVRKIGCMFVQEKFSKQ